MKRFVIALALAASGLFLWTSVGCEALKDAVDEVIENETGCTDEQLGALNEPDLPNCSKAVACCKFVKGECGEVTLITPPDGVIQACNVNETVLSGIIEEYQGLTEGDCPAALSAEACKDSLAETRENYRKAVDAGDVTLAGADAPSCQLIVDETVNKLNESLGEAASFLPAACEPVAVTLPNPGASDVVDQDAGEVDDVASDI